MRKVWGASPPPYALRDPPFEERRVLFECPVDNVGHLREDLTTNHRWWKKPGLP
jgi:hypothetical protein